MLIILVSLLVFTSIINAGDKVALENLLNDFLAGQTAAHHDRFWAEDLIYTSSSGARFDKAYIMQKVSSSADNVSDNDEDKQTTYSAGEVDIRLHDDYAIVAFKLLHKENGKLIQTYWNTGTFAKRDIGWQAIAWQATKIPNQDNQNN